VGFGFTAKGCGFGWCTCGLGWGLGGAGSVLFSGATTGAEMMDAITTTSGGLGAAMAKPLTKAHNKNTWPAITAKNGRLYCAKTRAQGRAQGISTARYAAGQSQHQTPDIHTPLYF
jgi:hypothetical protein